LTTVSSQDDLSSEPGRKGASVEPRSALVERLYRFHSNDLAKWLRRKFGDGPPEPEDIVHATVAKLTGMQSVSHIENFRAFLFTVASNIAVSAIRRNVHARTFVENELAIRGLEIEKITPERVYESKDELRQTIRAFDNLTDRQKEIVIRSRLYGQTYLDIRDAKGWSLGTIATDMKTAMRRLADSKNKSGWAKK